MPLPPRRVLLRPGDRDILEGWLRSPSTPPRLVRRARVLLGAADGVSGHAMERELGVSRPTVQRWLDRYEAMGLAGLEDRPRTGRPRVVTGETVAEVIRRTLEEAVIRGTNWSTRLMSRRTGLHPSQIQRIWAARGLVPGGQRTLALATDPSARRRVLEVAGCYLAPPERLVVFAVEPSDSGGATGEEPTTSSARSGEQATGRVAHPAEARERRGGRPAMPPIGPERPGPSRRPPGPPIQHWEETLFAPLEAAVRAGMPPFSRSRSHGEFLPFLEAVAARTGAGLELHLCVQWYAVHAHPGMAEWMARRPGAHVHFLTHRGYGAIEPILRELHLRDAAGGLPTPKAGGTPGDRSRDPSGARRPPSGLADLEAAARRILSGIDAPAGPFSWVRPPLRRG